MIAVSVRLPEELEARLKALAERTGRSKTSLIREAIQNHLEDLEDICLAEQRIADIRAGRSKTISIEEARTRLGLGD